MSDAKYQPFAPPLPPARTRALPWVTIAAGSLLTALPLIAPAPLLPPCGLLMLVAWRLLSPFALRPWAAAPLGFFDDLLSGQPLGSAVLLWSLCFLAVELVEQRLLVRTFAQDWAIAIGLTAACLAAGGLVGAPSLQVAPAIAAQLAASALLFPLAMRIVATVDAKRNRA